MGCRNLQGITIDACTGNKGGITTTVYIGERSDITITDTKNEQGVITGIAVAKATGVTGPAVTEFQFRKQSSGMTSEATIDDAQGIFFITSNLELVFAQQDNDKRMAMMSLFLNGNMFAIVKDGNGKIHFLGHDDPVTATAGGAQTGTAATDPNQYTITLTDISNELPFMITEAEVTALLAGE